ncbi:MAG TPA: hypothetical protein VEQ38_17125 [Verrucomicrobiae bacterium]|nr:hypothetical protein [Verrucomicrobiae bacterium]
MILVNSSKFSELFSAAAPVVTVLLEKNNARVFRVATAVSGGSYIPGVG